MMKWLVAFGILGAMWFVIGRSVMGPSIKAETYVETPEVYDKLYGNFNGVPVNNKLRTTPQVDVKAEESVIRWPAYKSNKVAAPPVELRIKKALWAEREPVRDTGWIAPDSVTLRVNWPEDEETRKNAPAREEPPQVYYFRSHGGASDKDLLYDEEYRSKRDIRYVTPLDAPREEAVLLYCNRPLGCTLKFEYLGRPAELRFPNRRAADWEGAHGAAKRLLASIATPITPK